ncbi:MAG: VOC family protein [Anaerolineales bacterium]
MLANYEVVATMPAVDIERAVNFYTNVLGLTLLMRDGDSATFEAGQGSKIFMYQREGTKAEHTAVTFNVPDLERVVDGLIQKGVVFEQYDFGEIKTDARGIASMDDGQAAWLTDPEGNILALVSMPEN